MIFSIFARIFALF
uniref:Uncharacterized protein n=1 Tax=Megaselia scalaris TaxID=36166 RepID=T1GAN2_MEGSC